MAKPLAARITAGGIAFSGIASKRSMTATAWSTSLGRPSLPEPNVEHALSRAAKTRKILAFMLSLTSLPPMQRWMPTTHLTDMVVFISRLCFKFRREYFRLL
jgi:hypothetical protein